MIERLLFVFRQDSENETFSVSCSVSQLNLVVSQISFIGKVRCQWLFVEETIQQSKHTWNDRQLKLCVRRSGADPCRKVRFFSKQCLRAYGAGHRFHQKERHCNRRRRGLVPPLEVDEMEV